MGLTNNEEGGREKGSELAKEGEHAEVDCI